MAKVVLVTHDVQTLLGGTAGGVGAFVTHFARLLRDAGDDVTILVTRQEAHPIRIDQRWRDRYAAWGIQLIEIHNSEPSPDRWCDPWPARLSEQVVPLLAGFDIAYFQDWANVAFCAARVKRCNTSTLPILITVLHGPSEWVRLGNRGYPDIPADLHLSYIERYAARHSDFVVTPSRYMSNWVESNDWRLPALPSVLGLPYFASPQSAMASPATTIRRLIFFGRLETRKGIFLLLAALQLLHERQPESLRSLSEIILLGREKEAGLLERFRSGVAALNFSVEHVGTLDSEQANAYIAKHAHDSIVIIPSIYENFPYAVIEASSIPGVQLLCSNGGGIPEVFFEQVKGLTFDPHPAALADRLAERLAAYQPLATPPYDAALANTRWLDFHRAALRYEPSPPTTRASASVDICIPYYDKPFTFPQLLTALEQQSSHQVGVIAVNDGSSPEASAVFDRAAAQYSARGWRFLTQPNAFVDAARNHAASISTADYLLFIDADDVPAPHAVERMLQAILHSGDDCLVTGGLLFESDTLPYDLATGEAATPILARYMPLGPDLVNGLVHPMVLGTSMIIVRRSAFEAIGGYRTVRDAAHEDWELQIRLLMAGFCVDVLPEFLLYFRKSADGLSLTSSDYDARRRLIDTYEDALSTVGLRGLATAIVALRQIQDRSPAPTRLHALVGEVLRRKGRP